MINLELFLSMSAIGYVAYIFVAESFNPFRRFEQKSGRKRKQRAKYKRQQFLHRCGLVAGGVFFFSPFILLFQPVVGGLSAQIKLCLISAGALLLVLLAIQSIAYLVGTTTSDPEEDELDEDESNIKRTPILLGSDSHVSRAASASLSNTNLENITINADQTQSTELDTILAEAEQERRLAETVELARTRENVYGTNAGKLKRKSMDTTMNRIRSVFRPEISISDAIVVNEDLETANDPEYTESEPQTQVAGARMRSHVTAIAESIPTAVQKASIGVVSTNIKITASLDKITKLITKDSQEHGKLKSQSPLRKKENSIITDLPGNTQPPVADMKDQSSKPDNTEDLIEKQRLEIERAKAFKKEIEKEFQTIKGEVTKQQELLEKSRETARSAALLARSAALKQQQALDLVEQEKKARAAAEEKAQKAVEIAKNAIAALAAQEEKTKKIVESAALKN